MAGQLNLKVTKAELEELNEFVNLLDCSDKLKMKVSHLVGYARMIEKAEKTKAVYDNLISADE